MAEKKAALASPEKKSAASKKDALETALAQIEKQFGKGAVMKLGANVAMKVDAISTGSLSLDIALGVGGVPRGRVVEVYGPESSGKTTLALHVLAEAQKQGGEVAFIDVEHALDPVYAQALGVDIDSLLVSQPDTGEQALERQPRGHRRRPRAEILLQRAHRRAPHRGPEGFLRPVHRQPHPRQGGQEQGGPALP